MKNKDELIEQVNKLPEFEYREIGLRMLGPEAPENPADSIYVYEQVPKHWTAITEVGSHDPITFASNRYKLMQFKESFIPLLQAHEDLKGRLLYNHGFAVLDIFPEGEGMEISMLDSTQQEPHKIGISAYNSVDRTSALIIRFSVTDGERTITLPKNISSFYQAHIGEVKQKADNYITLINQIKEFWPTVLQDMVKTDVTSELFETTTKEFKCDPNIKKAIKIELEQGNSYNLWQLILTIYDRMGNRKAKSDIHLRKRRDEFIQSTMNWAMMLKVFG